MGLKYSNFRSCFTRGTNSKASYNVFSHVNCEAGNITYQVGTDGDRQLHCAQLLVQTEILRGLLLTTPKLLISFLLCPLFVWILFPSQWQARMHLFLYVVTMCSKKRQIYSHPEISELISFNGFSFLFCYTSNAEYL